jgi:hypothetical protein
LKGDLHHRSAGNNTSMVPFTLLQMFGSPATSFGMAEGLVSQGIPEILA